MIRNLLIISMVLLSPGQADEKNGHRQSSGSDTLATAWKKLPDCDRKIGRFALTTDGRFIYRLGGIDFNIRAGEYYHKESVRFDTTTGQWEKLQLSLNPGRVAYDPNRQTLVGTTSISKLGEKPNPDVLRFWTYDKHARWKRSNFSLHSPEIGVASSLTHLHGALFVLLTSPFGHRRGQRCAILDVETMSLSRISNSPFPHRHSSAVHHNGSLYVFEFSQGRMLWKYDPTTNTWTKLFSISAFQPFWTDTYFSWNGRFFAWSNGFDIEWNRPSQLFEIDLEGRKAQLVTAAYPGPPARRSSGGIVVGDHFYILGGQRKDNDWLADMYLLDLTRINEN